MSLGFTRVIKTQACIDSLNFDSEVKTIISNFYSSFNDSYGSDWDSALPLTCREHAPEFKIRRAFPHDGFINSIKDNTKHNVILTPAGFKVNCGKRTILKVTSGEGSRNNKAGGGKAGLHFEETLASALKGETSNHQDLKANISSILESSYNIDLSLADIRCDGRLNKKRNPVFDGTRIRVDSGNVGETVSDITVTQGDKTAYLSLKWSGKFYLTNISIRKYLFEERSSENNVERNSLVRSLGFIPTKFFEPYGLVSTDSSSISNEVLYSNWKSLIQEILGSGYIYVVAGGKYDTILDLKDSCDVEILSIGSPVYSIPGIRKYSKIDLTVLINGKKYNLECQLRGTEATDTLPYYLRLVAK